ncbi:pilus assembly protein PilO [Rahnella sp. WP5]|uniref:pilus assembly protein PilO n=1 Tax=Rahnella sp. WP5 TaxID=1500266 RepID=UPI00056B0872|nr:pilus assembly protein PilO [Rahnella sp. WP5]
MTGFLSERIEPLMEKPGWQRVFILTACLVMMVLTLYQFGLRGLWQQQETLKREIDIAQQTLSLAQVTLMRMIPLERLEQELAGNATSLRKSLPLEQAFSRPLKDSQAVLIRWQPVSQPKQEPQGELQLQVTFTELMHFLHALLQRPEQPAFSELNLHTTGSGGMKASVLLTQTAPAAEFVSGVVASKAVRDPFNVPQTPDCAGISPLSEWLLSGISDVGGQRYGWLLSPQGRWNKVETGSLVGMPQWTVEVLSSVQVELSLSDARCGLQRQIIRLGKGNDSPGKGK